MNDSPRKLVPLTHRKRTLITPVASLGFAGLLAATVFVGPATVAAESRIELGRTAIGNYLAGRHAQSRRDLSAAADFLGHALKQAPDAPDLLRRTFILLTMEGRLEEARALAKKVTAANPKAPIANLVLATGLIKQGRYDDVEKLLENLPDSGLNGYTGPVLKAWAQVGAGNTKQALAKLKPLKGETGSDALYEIHQALILDVAGRREEAADVLKVLADKEGADSLRLTLLLGNLYARLGKTEDARALYTAYADARPQSRLLDFVIAGLDAGKAPAPLVANAKHGVAEAMFGIANSLRQQNARETGLVLGRLALDLNPKFPIALLMVGDILESDDRMAAANDIYGQIPAKSAFGLAARMRIAANLNDLDRTDEAIALLKELSAANPKNPQPDVNLGDVYRSKEMFAEAAEAYSEALRRAGPLKKRHWRLLYSRGIALERSKEWERAEADFLKALEFEPDQAHVLNYLGYSWVEQGVHLEEAQDMIKRAVKLRPRDGYITDSLGWVYYKLGKFEDAVVELERAVELRPEDPIINDHLGDAYWRVGRTLEATFQWTHSLSLEPEADLEKTLREKLKNGLEPAPEAPVADKEKPANPPKGG